MGQLTMEYMTAEPVKARRMTEELSNVADESRFAAEDVGDTLAAIRRCLAKVSSDRRRHDKEGRCFLCRCLRCSNRCAFTLADL